MMMMNVDPQETIASTSPELEQFHEQIFSDSLQNGLYGKPEDWMPIKRSGHFRRMAILDAMDVGDLSQATIGDFGTGPWGIACVFPKLRAARRCYGFDVSRVALKMAAEVDQDIAEKVTYLQSDGETIPLDDNSVDILWAGEVIEHVREPCLFLQEVARVCRDGGRLLLSTPNKDAVYYKARGEFYATGPEHVALMNTAEVNAYLELFFTDIRIVGYETSLDRTLDTVIEDEDVLKLIQDRAFDHPESASGLLASARVDKRLFAANAKSYKLQEIVWFDPRVLGQETLTFMRLFGDVSGGSLAPGASLSFVVSCTRIILLFWAHDWSGRATVEVNGNRTEVDLFSPGGGFFRFELPAAPNKHWIVNISRAGTKNARSVDDQVIFYKALCYTVEA